MVNNEQFIRYSIMLRYFYFSCCESGRSGRCHRRKKVAVKFLGSTRNTNPMEDNSTRRLKTAQCPVGYLNCSALSHRRKPGLTKRPCASKADSGLGTSQRQASARCFRVFMAKAFLRDRTHLTLEKEVDGSRSGVITTRWCRRALGRGSEFSSRPPVSLVLWRVSSIPRLPNGWTYSKTLETVTDANIQWILVVLSTIYTHRMYSWLAQNHWARRTENKTIRLIDSGSRGLPAL